MPSSRCAISAETLAWFFGADQRAYAPLTAFLVDRARCFGAGAEAEDLAQTQLFELLGARARGTLSLPNAPAFEDYLARSMWHRCARYAKRRRATLRRDEAPEPATAAADAPDAVLRSLQHVELCLQLIERALEQCGAPETMRAVLQRILDRFVLGREVEATLLESGLLRPDASAEERRAERNTENRRQSRARARLMGALHELKDDPRFEADDVQSAIQFVAALARCEPRDASTSNEESSHDPIH